MSLRQANFRAILIFALGMVLAVGFVLAQIARKEPVSSGSQVKNEPTLAAVDAQSIYQNLICSCCGKTIAECNCGMATERRGFVDGLVAAGKDEKGIYKEVFKKYGEEIIASETLAVEIKEELITEAPKDRPIILVEPESTDLGDVSMAKGNVQTTFKVKNQGGSNLELTGMETSCMCTTAFLRKEEEKSPVFGMHDNPTDWSTTLEPGQEADLVVIFDPVAHGPEGTGAVTRTVTVFSDDPIDSFKKVQLEANVVR